MSYMKFWGPWLEVCGKLTFIKEITFKCKVTNKEDKGGFKDLFQMLIWIIMKLDLSIVWNENPSLLYCVYINIPMVI